MTTVSFKTTPFEPKLCNRWVVRFGEPFKNIEEWKVKSVDRPCLKVEGNKGTWSDLVIKLIDVVGGPTTKSTEQLIYDGLKQIKNYKQNINVSLDFLDVNGNVTDSTPYVVTLKSIDIPSIDYSKNDFVIITMTFKPFLVSNKELYD
jgi:hypothetical protein